MKDTIYREDAIEAVAEDLASVLNVFKDETRELAEHALSALPSADEVSREDYEKIKNMVSTQFQTVLEDYLELEKRYVALLGKQSQKQSAEAAPKIDHDRDWIIGCLEHDGFIHTNRFDKANQIIHDALLADYVPGWIPCSERLPILYEDVLATDGEMCSVVTLLDDDWEDEYGTLEDLDTYIAWMPLPKPYKGGDAE